jgi:hypothetical protein
MMFLRLLPVVLSGILIAAHLLRGGHLLLVAVVLVMLVLLQVRERWVARAAQVMLALAALVWIRTAVALTQERIASHEPWGRMVVILGAVAAVTALSMLAFRQAAVRRWYGLDGESPAADEAPK